MPSFSPGLGFLDVQDTENLKFGIALNIFPITVLLPTPLNPDITMSNPVLCIISSPFQICDLGAISTQIARLNVKCIVFPYALINILLRLGYSRKMATTYHSIFAACSRIFSISFLIASTWVVMRISFAFDPIVLVSRLNSCTRKSIFLPTGSSLSRSARIFTI